MSTAVKVIRGVNLGGWLLLERYITPYLFAITSCDITGNFHSYPGQLGVPKNTQYHDFSKTESSSSSSSFKYDPIINNTIWDDMECKPILPYPHNEYTLLSKFESNRNIGREYLRRHWMNFITKDDIIKLKTVGGINTLRVPLGHWILGDILIVERQIVEPYVDGQWQYFVELCRWCREIGGIEVWPVISTTPGTEEEEGSSNSIDGWYNNPKNIERSLHTIKILINAIKRDGLEDVITSVGPLYVNNEINSNGNNKEKEQKKIIIRKFYDDALAIVRRALPKMGVFISDFSSNNNAVSSWNNEGYWIDEKTYSNTYLESYYSHVLSSSSSASSYSLRNLSPRQHIAYICRNTTRDIKSCCYEDYNNNQEQQKTKNTIVSSKGIQRIIGQWNVGYDILPLYKINIIMNNIAIYGIATDFHRTISIPRKHFLKNFAKAQIVTYENTSATSGSTSKGWFYSNFKMEGGAFAELDFLRGINETWIPSFPVATTSTTSSSLSSAKDTFGTCENIIFQTNDSMSIIHPYPPLNNENDLHDGIDDDVVLSHGKTLIPPNDEKNELTMTENENGNYYDDAYDDDNNNSQQTTPSPTTTNKSSSSIKQEEQNDDDSDNESSEKDNNKYVGNHFTFTMFISFIVLGVAWIRLKRFCCSTDYENIPAMDLYV